MSNEQVGKYIRLLCAQHQQGHLTHDHMINICQTYDALVFAKFHVDSDGKYYNERLEQEIVRRKNYSESRSKNRLSKKSDKSTYVPHMETETETSFSTNTDIKKDGEVKIIEPQISIPNLQRFKDTLTDQQLMVTFAKGLGKVLTIQRVLELSESHDIAFSEKFVHANYAKWKEYLRYFIRDHREPSKATQSHSNQSLTGKRVTRP